MAQTTLVRKHGLVRPLVTTSSNGPVRSSIVTRSLLELIITSVGNKLQAEITVFCPCLLPCLRPSATTFRLIRFATYCLKRLCSSQLLAQPPQQPEPQPSFSASLDIWLNVFGSLVRRTLSLEKVVSLEALVKSRYTASLHGR